MPYERDNVRRMAGYVYGEQPDDLSVAKLNTNENPFPPSPAVRDALLAFDSAALRRYPPATADDLRDVFAAQHGARREQVVVTNGGDEALRLALATFVNPGATLGLVDPAYSLLPVLAAAHGCRIATIALQPDWRPPRDFAARLNEARAELACIVNPHAPSGTLLNAGAIDALAAAFNGVLLVDEAYVDFVDPSHGHSLVKLVSAHSNLLLLRTLSKGYALAGLRVGFLLGDRDLIDPILTKTRDSFNVDAIAQTLATAALGDSAYAEARWREVRAERRRLAERLRALGFTMPPSETNFLLAQAPPGASARQLQQALRAAGVLVRHFDTPRLRDRLRITVGARQDNDTLVAALTRLLSQ